MKRSFIALAGLTAALVLPATGQSIAALTGTGTGSSSITDASLDRTPKLVERNPRYKLRVEDTFELDFPLSPEFNQTLQVQPDGYVTLQAAGSLYVEGQAVPELTQSVKTAYAKILHDPIVSVVLKDFEKPYFIAAGEVSKPGKYDLRGPTTVTEAIAIAGGFNDKAKHSQVVLFHRTAEGTYESKLLNVKKLLADRNLSEDIRLQPGDMLYVPQSAFSKIQRFIPTPGMGAYYNPAIY
jgi:polysaccharide export outer membrane protein